MIKRRIATLVADQPVIADAHRGGSGEPERNARKAHAASTRSTCCSRRSPIGWPTGASPPTRSTTADSSMSTPWPRSAATVRPSSRDARAGVRHRRARRASTGLRIDHPDGLLDPQTYLERLQEAFVLAIAPVARGGPGNRPSPGKRSSHCFATGWPGRR